METLLTLIHVLIAIILIGLVLIQDSKGGALGIGGGGSNSVLGAGGAQTLAAKATRWVAAMFAVTCIVLSIWTTKKTQSVVNSGLAIPAAAPAEVSPVAPVEAVPSAPGDNAPASKTGPGATPAKQ